MSHIAVVGVNQNLYRQFLSHVNKDVAKPNPVWENAEAFFKANVQVLSTPAAKIFIARNLIECDSISRIEFVFKRCWKQNPTNPINESESKVFFSAVKFAEEQNKLNSLIQILTQDGLKEEHIKPLAVTFKAIIQRGDISLFDTLKKLPKDQFKKVAWEADALMLAYSVARQTQQHKTIYDGLIDEGGKLVNQDLLESMIERGDIEAYKKALTVAKTAGNREFITEILKKAVAQYQSLIGNNDFLISLLPSLEKEDYNTTKNVPRNALHILANKGNVEHVRKCLDSIRGRYKDEGCSQIVDLEDYSNQNDALKLAASSNNHDVVSLLLQVQPNPLHIERAKEATSWLPCRGESKAKLQNHIVLEIVPRVAEIRHKGDADTKHSLVSIFSNNDADVKHDNESDDKHAASVLEKRNAEQIAQQVTSATQNALPSQDSLRELLDQERANSNHWQAQTAETNKKYNALKKENKELRANFTRLDQELAGEKNRSNLLEIRVKELTSSNEKLLSSNEELKNTVQKLQASWDQMSKLLEGFQKNSNFIPPLASHVITIGAPAKTTNATPVASTASVATPSAVQAPLKEAAAETAAKSASQKPSTDTGSDDEDYVSIPLKDKG